MILRLLPVFLLGLEVKEGDNPLDPPLLSWALLRRPVALALSGDGAFLAVANGRSGSVTVIEMRSLQPVAEVPAGRRLAGLAAVPDSAYLIAADATAHEIILLEWRGSALRALARSPVPGSPVGLRVARDGSQIAVATPWSRAVTILELMRNGSAAPEPSLKVLKHVELPFAPREQLFIGEGSGSRRVVAAGAFGGQIAVIEPAEGRIESVREIPGHNIRGLALSPDGMRLLVSHQVLNSLARTSFDDVHWGSLMTGNVRALALTTILDPGRDLLEGSRLCFLGEAGNGAGDPGAIAADRSGRLIVALSGVDEIAVAEGAECRFRRLPVGKRPAAILADPRADRFFVANFFADSISVIEAGGAGPPREIPLGRQATLGPADRGELLFFDARLSHDRWFSCHSCHTDGHASGLLNDNFSDGSFGTPKRILSLLGTGDTGPWGWNGRAGTLEDQIRSSIALTLRGEELSSARVNDLAAYLRALAPPPPDLPQGGKEQAVVAHGEKIFEEQGCGRCHIPPSYTSREAYDVGLADEEGETRFNPPSLRGTGHRPTFFHDGRAKSLLEVFTRHAHQLRRPLQPQEASDLARFLQSL